MASKSTKKNQAQYVGLGLFALALLFFTVMLGLDNYQLSEDKLTAVVEGSFDAEQSGNWQRDALLAEATATGFYDQVFSSTFAFEKGVKSLFKGAQKRIEDRIAAEGVPEGKQRWQIELPAWVLKGNLFNLTQQSAFGPVTNNPRLWFQLTFLLAIVGGLLYILPKFRSHPGIKHDHIYHNPLTRGLKLGWRSVFIASGVVGILAYGIAYMDGKYVWPAVTTLIAVLITSLVLLVQRSWRNSPARDAGPEGISGWLGILAGTYFIGFYVLLYWFPQHIVAWVQMVDPISRGISGNGASQWFLYGLMYTVIMGVMGVRMFAKYRHNKYQLIRTGSVLFFQTSFAFLLPEILVALNKPWYDFKNIWPLDYDFFHSWSINGFIDNPGSLGMFMLFWGVALIIVGVPLMVYFLGKRWYCRWVCGCGGLAETMGDPWRQLAIKVRGPGNLSGGSFTRFCCLRS